MTGQGQIFASGISLVLTAPGTSLLVPAANGALKYLLLVDSDGNPIVPVYEATTVDGVAMAGVRIALPSLGGVASLEARVTTAEGDIDSLENFTQALSNDISGLDTRLTAQELIETPTALTFATNLNIDWGTLGTRTAKIVLPPNMPNASITASNIVDGVTYTVICPHVAGGIAADGFLFNTSIWKTNGLLPMSISGDPNYVYVWKFVGYGGKMLNVGGFVGDVS